MLKLRSEPHNCQKQLLRSVPRRVQECRVWVCKVGETLHAGFGLARFLLLSGRVRGCLSEAA